MSPAPPGLHWPGPGVAEIAAKYLNIAHESSSVLDIDTVMRIHIYLHAIAFTLEESSTGL